MDISLKENIAGTFRELHKEIKQERITHYWLKGGRSSGKSSFVSIEIVFGLLRDKDANALIYRQVGKTLSDSVVEQIQWAINILNVGYMWEPKKSPYEFINKNTGQRIIFKGNDDEEKSKGIKLAKGYFKFIWYEELTEFKSMEAVETINRTLLRGNGFTRIFYTYNPPKNVSNWVNQEAKINKKNKLVHHSTYKDMPKEWLGEQILEDARFLEQQNNLQYRWAYLGEEIGIGGLILKNWELTEVNKDLSFYDDLSIGQDFGFNHANAILLLGFKDGNIYILKEQYNKGLDTQEIINRCTMPKNVSMFCDSAEPDRIKTWKGAGYRAQAVRKEQNSVHAQIDYLSSHKIYIDVSCVNTLKEIQQWSWKRDEKNDRWLDEPVAFMDDAMAALRYGIEPQRKPYGVGVYNVMM